MIGYSRYFSNLISFIVVGIIIEKVSITHFKLIQGDVLMCISKCSDKYKIGA